MRDQMQRVIRVERRTPQGAWASIELQALQPGDVFRVFNLDEALVRWNNQPGAATEFEVTAEPYQGRVVDDSQAWSVDCIPRGCPAQGEAPQARQRRTVERWDEDGWRRVQLCELHQGDRFRMFEIDGALVHWDGALEGSVVFLATGNAYEKGWGDCPSELLWTVDCVPMEAEGVRDHVSIRLREAV